MKGIHQELPFIMDGHEGDPGETEKKNKTIEDQEGGESRFSILFP
jgi:hypothetical protein